jgi:hypothetical protein
MILKTEIRPDRFHRILAGKKKVHRIPVQYIELTENKYEVIILTTSFYRSALIEILSIRKDEEKQEYVIALGEIKSTRNLKKEKRTDKDNNYQMTVQKNTKKKYIHKCEILRDGQRVGILNLSTKQGRKQRTELGRLQGYSFNDLPLEIISQ